VFWGGWYPAFAPDFPCQRGIEMIADVPFLIWYELLAA